LFDEAFGITHDVIGAAIEVHKSQLLSYMKLVDVPLGLKIDFHAPELADGLSRFFLPGANLI